MNTKNLAVAILALLAFCFSAAPVFGVMYVRNIDEFKKRKDKPTFVLMGDIKEKSAAPYIKALKENWTATELIVLPEEEAYSLLEPGSTVLWFVRKTITYRESGGGSEYQRYSGALMYCALKRSFFQKKQPSAKKKFRLFEAQPPDLLDKIIPFVEMPLYYGRDSKHGNIVPQGYEQNGIYNWSPGFLGLYARAFSHALTNATEIDSKEYQNQELLAQTPERTLLLAPSVQQIEDVTPLLKKEGGGEVFLKPVKVEKEFKPYKYPRKTMSAEKLEIVLDRKEEGYILVFSRDKYSNFMIFDNKTGALVCTRMAKGKPDKFSVNKLLYTIKRAVKKAEKAKK